MLRRALDAIANGTALPSTVVIVDQSVRDQRTRSVVDDFEREVGSVCRVLHHPSSGGMARGQNEGFALIEEPAVVVTDDDCVPSPDWVVTAARAFSGARSSDLVCGRVLPLGPEGPERRAVATRTSTEPLVATAATDPWDLGSGNNFAVRRDAILAIGGNDVRLGPGAPLRGAADIDLFRRLVRGGWTAEYRPELLVHHERVSVTERRARRVPYGYGMGAACVLWRRQGDRGALRTGRRYVALRLRRLRQGVGSRDRTLSIEELLVLWGFCVGVVRGLTTRQTGPHVGDET